MQIGASAIRGTVPFFAATLLFAIASVPALAASCTVSTGGVAFGAYDTLGVQPGDTSGNITVSCTGTAGELVNLTLSTATNTRNLQGPRRSLLYQLYVDSSRTQIWGDGTSGTSTISGSITVGSNGTVTQSYYVYGRIAGGQSAAEAGSYSDTLLVYLNW